ncbi:MAG: flagellin [Candidatus Melainabacteria bacterium]
MGIFLNTNVSSLNAQRSLGNVTMNLNKSIERLSSGYKINKASDGSASLLTSENLRAQIRGSQVAIGNAQQGIGMLNTADGALQSMYSHLQRIREIAVEASNGTVSDYTAANAEISQRMSAITAISDNTNYDNQQLLDGSVAAMTLQIGANSGETLAIATAFADRDATALGLSTSTLASAANATTLMGEVDTAMNNVATALATVGGFTGQLENVVDNLSITVENLTASESTIRNTDIAAETSTLARLQILQQAAASALASANQMPSVAMRLLQ